MASISGDYTSLPGESFFYSTAYEPPACCAGLCRQVVPSFFAAVFTIWKTVSLSPQPFTTILLLQLELCGNKIDRFSPCYLLSRFFESNSSGNITWIQRKNSKYWQLSPSWKGILWLSTILLEKEKPPKMQKHTIKSAKLLLLGNSLFYVL